MIDPKKLADRFPGDFTFGVATAAGEITGKAACKRLRVDHL